MNSKKGKKPVGTAKKPKPEALMGDLFAAAFKRHKCAAAATIAAVLVLAVIAAWLCGRSGIAEGEAVFYFFDVGQGDAAAVVTSEGCILIDAGTNDAEDELCRQMRRAGIRRIDLAVLTHPHEDHIGGADAVIDRFEVGRVLISGRGTDTAAYSRLCEAAERRGTDIGAAEAGYTEEIGGMKLDVLFADEDAVSENDMSAVVKVEFGSVSAIYTGDAGEKTEGLILGRYERDELECDILKVGHHGSQTSSSREWLEALSPGFAVISCAAANDYGHPHAAVLRRLADLGAEVHRTDIEGTVVFVSDGESVKNASGSEKWQLCAVLPHAHRERRCA